MVVVVDSLTCWTLIFYSIFVGVAYSASRPPPVDMQIPAAAEGEHKLNELQRLAENPKYGKCWTEALATLKSSCRSLSDQQQQVLALSFTNCHLLMSGK